MKLNPEVINQFKIELPVQLITGLVIAFLSGLVWVLWAYIEPHFYWLDNPVTVQAYLLVIDFFAGAGTLVLGWATFKYFQKSYKDYRKDEFFSINWKWNYIEDTKDVDEDSIKAICPNCNSLMNIYESDVYEEFTGLIIKCKNQDCEYRDLVNNELQTMSMTRWDLFDKVVTKIDRNLRNQDLKL